MSPNLTGDFSSGAVAGPKMLTLRTPALVHHLGVNYRCQAGTSRGDSPGMHTDAHQPSTLAFNHDTTYFRVIDSRFLHETLNNDLPFMLGAEWVTGASLEDAPGDVLAKASYHHAETTEMLIRLAGSVAQLTLRERSLVVRIAAVSEDSAHRVRDRLSEALPEVDGSQLEVPIRFWWWQEDSAQQLARVLSVPSWKEVAENYEPGTRTSLDSMMAWNRPPVGGRLFSGTETREPAKRTRRAR